MIVRISNCSKTTVDKREAEGSLADGSFCQGVGGNLIEKGERRTVHSSKGEDWVSFHNVAWHEVSTQ